MKKVRVLYDKNRIVLERYLFPLFLILYPLLRINQGLDVADTTYSLSNFEFFSSMDGTWMVATFLANVAGSLLMKLPYGNMLLGIYFYTALSQSVTAWICYRTLRKKMPAVLVFVGEWIALGLCWCPSTILYNYLTYLFLTCGMLLLYRGIVKGSIGCYIGAGIFLGANVAVRMPNVVQMALIVGLWYGVCLKREWSRLWKDTLWCILGYALGFGIPYLAIGIRYGWNAYPAMVQTMFAMTDKAVDYKPSAMLLGMFGDYGRGLFWLFFALLCMAGAVFCVMFGKRLIQGRTERIQKTVRVVGTVCYVCLLLIVFRLYWGRGLFSFRYYEYSSIYYPAVLLLLAGMILAAGCLLRREEKEDTRVFAMLVLLQIFVTPLGSNNDLYPIINCLFVVLPFTLWQSYERGKCMRKPFTMVWRIPTVLLCLFVLVQSVGFHMLFAFQDGVNGEKRTTTVSVPRKAQDIYTTEENGELLQQLAACVQEEQLTGQSAIFYGETPGLGYLLDMPSALSTFWPDLDSYRFTEFEQDMQKVRERGEQAPEELPVVFLSAAQAAYLSGDEEAMEWFGVDREKLGQDEKLRALGEFMKEQEYGQLYCNARYAVYTPSCQR